MGFRKDVIDRVTTIVGKVEAIREAIVALPPERGTDDAELEVDAAIRFSALGSLAVAIEEKLDAWPAERGTDGALLAVDYEAERGTDSAELEADALDRFNKLRQKATAPAWDQDTDSLEAIREVCESIVSKCQIDAARPSTRWPTQGSTTIATLWTGRP